MFAVAPGEGQKPIGLLNDKHFEDMCIPTKYPTGRHGLVTERRTRLTVRKYYNQRLLDADGRFARDIEYLLTQYAVENKQVADDNEANSRPTAQRTGGHCSSQESAGDIRNDSKGLCLSFHEECTRLTSIPPSRGCMMYLG